MAGSLADAAAMMDDEDVSPVLWLRRAVAVANIEAEVRPLLADKAAAKARMREQFFGSG